MDTHAKRINRINMDSLDEIGLPSDGSVDISDCKNFIWVPIFFTYTSAVAPDPIEKIYFESPMTLGIHFESPMTLGINFESPMDN